ncbi:MAG: TerB family tellurite resistance protein [Pseudomonadota bacterium]
MLKKLLERLLDNTDPETAAVAQDEQLRLAAAALLVEVALADGSLDDSEQERMQRTLIDQLGVAEADVRLLLNSSVEAHFERVGVQDLTRALTENWSEPDRFQLIVALWQVAFADDELDPHEEHRIRHIAELLYVSHRRFIEAKQIARGTR